MTVPIDQLVRENAILIKDNPARFFDEKKHLQAALRFMEEDNNVWKFKSTVPTANAINIKNKLGQDNYRMKGIAESIIRKSGRLTSGDKTKKMLVIAIAAGAVGVGVWWLFFRKKKNNIINSPQEQTSSSSVFEAIMKKPKRTPRKIVRKMIMEEFGDEQEKKGEKVVDEELIDDEGEEN
jgi:hypothetical protein